MRTFEPRPWTGTTRWVPGLLLLTAGTAWGQTPESTPPARPEEPPMACSSCGVELLPHSREYVDDEGRPICDDCATKAESGDKTPKPYDLKTSKYLLGDWGGKRSKLKDEGISFRLRKYLVPQVNIWGGRNTNTAHTTSGQMGYAIEFDFEKLAELGGSTLYIRARQTWNDHTAGIRPDVGSLSKPYGGAGGRSDNELFLDKYHWRQRWLDDRIEFRFGLLEAKDYFDRNEYANSVYSQFPNAVLELDPTFPNTKGIGVFAKVWPTDWLYIAAGAIDPDRINTHNRHGTGGFDTAFHGQDKFRAFAEFGLLPDKLPNAGGLPGHYRFGCWLTPKPKTVIMEDLDGDPAIKRRSDDVGFYLNMDQLVWKENNDPKDKQGLGLFARYGFAHKDVNRLSHFWSVGASYKGLVPSRDKDTLGFGVAQTILSKQYRREIDTRADRETVYDLYYSIVLTPWCKISPDIQVVTNPGGNKDARDALVAGVRVQIDF